MSPHPPRHTHRKRVSALRLSSDTTSTLPEYITVGTWEREDDDVPSDKPPDYPDSAEEADADTDSDTNNNTAPASVYVPPLSPSSVSPRRQRRFAHRRKKSTSQNDPYLDSLLHRSVQALEMSNTLLQTSMSTQTSLSNIFAANSPDEGLETSARGLSMRIQDLGGRSNWQDDLAEITREVEGLFNDDEGRSKPTTVPSSSSSTASGISSSLPSTSPLPQLYRQQRRPSMLELHNTYDSVPQLQLAPRDRSNLVSPPPRALTQYIASASNPDLITLPPTLGVRTPSTSHLVPLDKRPSCGGDSSCSQNLHAALSSPQLTDKPLEPSTPAYNMLASLVNRASSSGSSTPSTSLTSTITSPLASFLATSRRNSQTRNSSRSAERGCDARAAVAPAIPDPLKQKLKSPDSNASWSAATTTTPTTHDRSPRSLTPKQIIHSLPNHNHHNHHRPMTPPTEESSCSSSESNPTKRTILSLRKILDDQPPPPPPPERERPAFLLPRTSAPAPEAGTSTATASISRLYTKAKHSSSTRPPSPPRHSAMKQSLSQQPSPLPSPTATNANGNLPAAASVPDLLGFVKRNNGSASASSSGRSTPKRISFAELPESYSSSKPRPPGVGGLFGASRRKGKRKAGGGGRGVNGKLRAEGGKESSINSGAGTGAGWWSGWLSNMGSPTGVGLGVGGPRSYEQTEDRLTRAWGGRMAGAGFGSSTLDEWTV